MELITMILPRYSLYIFLVTNFCAAIWFWMQNTGSTGTTCHDAIMTNADFGASLNTINGGLECPARSSHAGSVISRLDDYCRAVNALGANLLLSFDGCTGLEQRHAECLEASTCPNCVGIPILSPTNPVTFAPTKSPVVLPTRYPTKNPTKLPTKKVRVVSYLSTRYICT